MKIYTKTSLPKIPVVLVHPNNALVNAMMIHPPWNADDDPVLLTAIFIFSFYLRTQFILRIFMEGYPIIFDFILSKFLVVLDYTLSFQNQKAKINVNINFEI